MVELRANLGRSVHLLENRRVQCLWHLRACELRRRRSAAKLESQGMAVCQCGSYLEYANFVAGGLKRSRYEATAQQQARALEVVTGKLTVMAAAISSAILTMCPYLTRDRKKYK